MNSAMILPTTVRPTRLPDFNHVFQPIFSLEDQRLYGFESLIRCGDFPNPEILFSVAKQQKQLFEMDMKSVVKSITTFRSPFSENVKPMLSVNIFPSTVVHPRFLPELYRLMSNGNFASEDIIFELNEAESVDSLAGLMKVIKELKENGFKIALDDLGKGQSSLRIALELEPDIIKLDRYFCQGLDQSLKKQKFLEWITSYFVSEGVAVTLEGIETEAELAIARQAGVPFGQGYYLGRPKALELTK